MSTVAGRKKSVISSNGLQIETPVAHNTFLNQSAAQSTSLYQRCAQLRTRLLRIHGFPEYFAKSSSEHPSSTTPVDQMWDCFAMGTPLCFLHNLLPNVHPIANVDPTDKKANQKAIIFFAMAINNTDLAGETDQFRVTELLDRKSTEGLVKVVNCVTRLVDRLPESCFLEVAPLSPPAIDADGSSESLVNPESPVLPTSSARDVARQNVIREMVETERKYVQELEHMQKYANALSSSSAINQDTIHVLFPGLSKLLDFQRRFLITLEGCVELPWKEQRWGMHFTRNEEEFAVYEPYCANYIHALHTLSDVEHSLMSITLINVKELPAYLIKPVQRICKYPLLLDSLLKASSASDYPYYEELKAGCAAAKRSTDRINEAQRRAENGQTVQTLQTRVADWKGHHLSNFGDLLLDDIFMVNKMDIDREYHVFLFEKIVLCCKELLDGSSNGSSRKVNKSNSILKKPNSTSTNLPGGVGPPKKKDSPLLLKGRIFLNNVTHVQQINQMGNYLLQVWWRGDNENEYFTLRCRTEEQLKQWETQINRLIAESAARRASDRSISALAAHVQSNSTNPALGRYESSRALSIGSQLGYFNDLSPTSGPSSGNRRYPPSSPYGDEPRAPFPSNVGPSGYPPDDAFELDDDFEEYPPASGRGTPLGTRRGNVAQSMFPERDVPPGYDRPRARTEDMNGPIMQQWKRNRQAMPPPPPPPIGGLPTPDGLVRPQAGPRSSSNASDTSFGPGTHMGRGLRSQFSSSKLSSAYENSEGHATPPTIKAPPMQRSRSSSQPSAYHPPKGPAPPLPTTTWADRSKSSLGNSTYNSKRGSDSSGSTGESSDYSPHTSPITPFGSSDSSLAGSTIRTARSQTFSHSARTGGPTSFSSLVKVKVHFHEDIFVIQVPRSTEYTELVEKVGKKIRLCGPRRDDGPLRVKYVDEDGDMVSLGSTEDVQMAFETLRPSSQVTLYVQ